MNLLERLPITEKEVKEILRSHTQLLDQIHSKIYEINKDIAMKDELIEVVSFKTGAISDMPTGKGGQHDLSDTYLRYLKELEKQKHELNEVLSILILNERKIERVWLAFRALGEPYYTILNDMYVKNEKFKVAANNSGMSERSFNKQRAQGIKAIIRFYESDEPLYKLLKIEGVAERDRVYQKQNDLDEEDSCQLDLLDFLGGSTE